MSILIKGMEMSKSCFYCPFHEKKKVNLDDYICRAVHKECPYIGLIRHFIEGDQGDKEESYKESKG